MKLISNGAAIRSVQNSANATPAVTVQGAFTEGGNSSGTVAGPSRQFRIAELFDGNGG